MTATTNSSERKIDATDVGLVMEAGAANATDGKINRAQEVQRPVLYKLLTQLFDSLDLANDIG